MFALREVKALELSESELCCGRRRCDGTKRAQKFCGTRSEGMAASSWVGGGVGWEIRRMKGRTRVCYFPRSRVSLGGGELPKCRSKGGGS